MLTFVAEFIGTFLLVSVILAVGQPIPIAAALLASLYFGGHISGGHYNPAVSTVFLAKRSISFDTYVGYVLAQFLGAAAALVFHRRTVNNSKL